MTGLWNKSSIFNGLRDGIDITWDANSGKLLLLKLMKMRYSETDF